MGPSTLRYYFPTQRELMDAVLQSIYQGSMPDERIHDDAVPAADRLIECLSNVLTPIGSGEQAREFWRQLVRSLTDSASGLSSPLVHVDLDHQSSQRVESWLAVLAAEGALPAGDHADQALFLLTVVDGLAIGRVLPSDELSVQREAMVLQVAVGAVLQGPGRAGGAGAER